MVHCTYIRKNIKSIKGQIMETIYSRVIWKELGLKDYKIHEEPQEKTEELILNWLKETPKEKADEVLHALSWITSVEEDSYYDGPFHGINQRNPEDRVHHEGEPTPDLLIHDTGLESSILHLAIETQMSPSGLRFIASLLEEYYKKIPKENSCQLK